MRVSHKLMDEIDGLITQTRVINEQEVYFERFIDRYSLLGHGRIINAFDPETGRHALGSAEIPKWEDAKKPEETVQIADEAETGPPPSDEADAAKQADALGEADEESAYSRSALAKRRGAGLTNW